MDASEIWMIIRFTPHQTTTLPTWKFFQNIFFIHRCCKMASAAFKYVPQEKRRPFALFPVWFFSLKLILSVSVQEENHSPHPRLPLLPGKPRGLWPPNIRVHPRYVHSFFEFTRTYQLVQCTAVLGSYPEIFLFLDPCCFTRLLY